MRTAPGITQKEAHKHSIFHRQEIESSEWCACFRCLKTFEPSKIVEWVDPSKEGCQTALCPFCGIDSVIGSSSGLPMTKEFLKEMYEDWF